MVSLKYLESHDAAIKQESGYSERAGPAIKRVTSGDSGKQSYPNETTDQVKMKEAQQRVKQIHAGRVAQMAENIDRIVRPERYAVGEISDKGYVQRQVPEIIRALDLQFRAIIIKQPAKRAEGEDAETRHHQPEPDRAVTRCFGQAGRCGI